MDILKEPLFDPAEILREGEDAFHRGLELAACPYEGSDFADAVLTGRVRALHAGPLPKAYYWHSGWRGAREGTRRSGQTAAFSGADSSACSYAAASPGALAWVAGWELGVTELGRIAFLTNVDATSNPYSAADRRFGLWLHGWRFAYRECLVSGALGHTGETYPPGSRAQRARNRGELIGRRAAGSVDSFGHSAPFNDSPVLRQHGSLENGLFHQLRLSIYMAAVRTAHYQGMVALPTETNPFESGDFRYRVWQEGVADNEETVRALEEDSKVEAANDEIHFRLSERREQLRSEGVDAYLQDWPIDDPPSDLDQYDREVWRGGWLSMQAFKRRYQYLREGRAAFEARLERTNCPYSDPSDERNAWLEGWNEGHSAQFWSEGRQAFERGAGRAFNPHPDFGPSFSDELDENYEWRLWDRGWSFAELDTYISGSQASSAGEPLEACPHENGSAAWATWRNGWMDQHEEPQQVTHEGAEMLKAAARSARQTALWLGHLAACRGEGRGSGPHLQEGAMGLSWLAGWELGHSWLTREPEAVAWGFEARRWTKGDANHSDTDEEDVDF